MTTTAVVSPGFMSAGSRDRKYSSGENSSVLVSHDRKRRISSMLRQITVPSRKPTTVPTTPIEAPVIRNTRMIAPWVAPMVRRMAMSEPLSLTSMIRPETILSAATSTINVRIRNITLRST